jgi:hypothetical protein
MLNYNFIENCCKNATSYLQNSKKVLFTMIFSLIISSCSLWSPSDKKEETKDEIIKKKDWEPNVDKRVDEARGKGITIFGGGNRDSAATADNVIWQASLEVLADIPLAQANYTGGVIITDWYNSSNSNESIKISIFINSARLEVNSFDVKSFKKTCSTVNNCQTVNLTPDFNQKIKDRVLEKARIISVKKETSKK